MKYLHTIGFTRKSLRRFVEALRAAGVQQVVDVRLRNTSHLAGFAKKEDLAYLLEELLGIRYLHLPELAPTDEMLERYRRDRDWATYEDVFGALLEGRDPLRLLEPSLSAYDSICLLCSEDKPARCHRRLVAEHVAARRPEVTVAHL